MKSVVNFYGAIMVMGFSSLYGAIIPYDHSRGQTWVATLELNDSLYHPLINWADQTFELKGFKEIRNALQFSSNVIYLEGDHKNQNWRIWIHHDDPRYERETQWVEAVAKLLGLKAKKMDVQGFSVWVFDDGGEALVLIYQSNSVEILRLKTYKERLGSNLKKI